MPGDDAWEAGWAQLFAGRGVSVIMDCDRPSREAAIRIASDLKAAGVRGSVIDLAPGRDDAYDLTDWLDDRRDWPLKRIRRSAWRPRRPGGRACGVAAVKRRAIRSVALRPLGHRSALRHGCAAAAVVSAR